MEIDPDKPPIIDYETPEPEAETSWLDNMMTWRSICGGCFWIAILSLYYFPLLLFLSAGLAVACAAVCLIYMTRAAASEVGLGYAIRHLVLAVLLMPVLFLGVFLVPVLVKSDLMKWRRVGERKVREMNSNPGPIVESPPSRF